MLWISAQVGHLEILNLYYYFEFESNEKSLYSTNNSIYKYIYSSTNYN